jgi:hypothetical protein
MSRMDQNNNVLQLFRRAIGNKIMEATGLNNTQVFFERSKNASYPRIAYSYTVWAEANSVKGTLQLNIAVNTSGADADDLVQKLRNDLDRVTYCADDLFYYLYSFRAQTLEDSDKSIFKRLVTLEFTTMGGN